MVGAEESFGNSSKNNSFASERLKHFRCPSRSPSIGHIQSYEPGIVKFTDLPIQEKGTRPLG